ncbi:GntR family transcriptional regulator YhfZ [Streptomyces oceani]|uniref:GntR family transcriptional regulator n=1 Tax=Streptomyces oceani TaxID=1075402 RepID=A0A1E7JRJ7_9ACTN|nr:GntR family transcriptional regulator YhfZ [Streptomyces oceani]OEU91402.1 GntR family transcriptional regulator [Streptomyces oceani]
MLGSEERFLTRNGLAARQLAALLLHHETDTRLPRLRDFASDLKVGNGTVQTGLQLLEEAGAIETKARGHLGTYLVRSDRTLLWQLAGLGTLLAAMPLPYSHRYEGLATGLRAAFEQVSVPFAITFMRGASTRLSALLEGKADLVVVSRFAADRIAAEHPVRLLADLGPATYVGAHGLLLRREVPLETPGLRVAVDSSSEDLRMLASRAFTDRDDIVWVETSYMQLRDLFARGEVDATVWNLDEVRDHLGPEVEVQPLGNEITRDLALRNSRAALISRSEGTRALDAVRDSLDFDVITGAQSEVLSGERLPLY